MIELVGKCCVSWLSSTTNDTLKGHFGSNVGSSDADWAALPQAIKDRMSTGSKIATTSLFAYIFLIYSLKACLILFFLRITSVQ
jgi:hypothetical protein